MEECAVSIETNALIEAVKKNDVESARNELNNGISPDVVDSQNGLSALMLAACRGFVEMSRLLVDSGADIHRVDPLAGTTALHKACQSGSLPIVRMLVEKGAFIDQQLPTTGHSPLLMAVWFKWPDLVQYFLDNGATLNLRTHFGFSLDDQLDFALKVTKDGRDKLLDIVALIKKRRADDDLAVANQKLMAAVVVGDFAVAKAQVDAGADVNQRFPRINVFNDAHTPLIVAARDGYYEICELLVNAGADVNAVEPTFGAVPLHKAAYNGHTEIIQLLCRQPGIDMNVQGPSNGYTPLHDAIWLGYPDCAESLVHGGARLDIEGHDGMTPLMLVEHSLGTSHPLYHLIKQRSA